MTTPRNKSELAPSLESVIGAVWRPGRRVFKFETLDEELDVLLTWKKISMFSFHQDDFAERSQAIFEGAARRGLRVTVVPEIHEEERVALIEMYVHAPPEAWRCDALRELRAVFSESGRPWSDDLDRARSRLLGYSKDDTEAWIQQNYEFSAFWTGCRRSFIALDPRPEDVEHVLLHRSFPDEMQDWWVVSISGDWRLADPVSMRGLGVRAALREDPMREPFSVGETITFAALEDVEARRVRASGHALNEQLRSPLDVVLPRPMRPR